MTQVLNIADAEKAIMSMRGCKVLAQNVPACTNVDTNPNAWEVENPFYFNWLFLGEHLLEGCSRYTENFPIPFETVIRNPEDKVSLRSFEWGRRYKEVGYFLQYPDKPGFGTVYNRTPYHKVVKTYEEHPNMKSTTNVPCLPSLDLVELWQDGGDDGHTSYYCNGMLLIPTQYWGSIEDDEWHNDRMYKYPRFVWDMVDAQRKMLYAMSSIQERDQDKEIHKYLNDDYYDQELERSKKTVASCVEAMREDMDPVNLDSAIKS